jgi:hypothetical protein
MIPFTGTEFLLVTVASTMRSPILHEVPYS